MKICSLIGALICLPILALAEPAQTQLLQGHRPAAFLHLTPVGRLEAARELKLAIGLPLRDKEGLTNLLGRIYDPASPDYRHFLTPAQFADTFGPTEKDYQKLTAFAIANGLKVSATHPNRAFLDVTGTVSNIEKAFHITLRTYPHPREKRAFYAPDVEPSLNLETPVLHISGLDNYLRPHPMFSIKSPLAGFTGFASGGGSGPSGAYLGQDFRAAYFPGLPLTGAGQSIGLLEFDGYYTNDISTYANIAGISAVPLTNVYLDGFDGTAGVNNTEVALDIDMASCMAPGVSSVIVYAGELGDDMLNRMATDGVANQLSSSWSYSIDAATEQIFQQFAAQGQSFFNASGDNDAWVGAIPPPCDDPNITIVGGTTLTTHRPEGSWVSETIWNWGVEYGPSYNGQGSSGGISTTYEIPAWQMGVSMTLNQGSVHYRNVPDVALTADNVFVVADNGQGFDVAGTSCATPLWAAIVALANEQAVAQGRPKVGFINPAIYALGLSRNYTNCFHDITTGNNIWSQSPKLFSAVAGYDLCSGWGTPMGSNLVNLLAPADVLQILPLGAWSSIGGVGGPLHPSSQNYTLTNSGSTNLNWAAGATVPWLSLSLNGGKLTPGGAAATVVASLNAAANNLSVGTYFATIWFTNLSDGIAQCRASSLEIIAPPIITVQPANLAVIGGATATFTAGAAGGLPLNGQWQYNNVNITAGGRVSVSQAATKDQSNIYGNVGSTLTISNVAAADSGNYAFLASNVAGEAISSNAVLAIAPSMPVIVQQPASQTALVGATVQFTVMVNGTAPFTYQWQQNQTNLTDGAAVAGSLTSTLTINSASSASIGTYTVLVSNTMGASTSAGASLMVQVAVPGQQLVQNGGFETGDFSFWDETGNFVNCSVSTNYMAVDSGDYGALLGPPDSLGYLLQSLPTVPGQSYLLSLWLDSPDGVAPNEFLVGWNGSVMFDQTNLGALAWTNLQFYVTATDANTVLEFGFQDDESYLGLDDVQVIPLANADGPPIIATQPANQVAVQGGRASFSVVSSGGWPLSYQWQFDGNNLENATNATLILSNLTTSQAGAYDVLVSNSLGWTTSASALLTVLSGSTEFITFDDLPDILSPVPDGYNGLMWSNFYYLNGLTIAPSGYSAGVISMPKVAYNGDGTPAAISASEPFALLSAYLTAAWNVNLQLEVQGYNGPSLIYDNTYNLSATAPTLIAFNYVGVTSVQFISSDGVPYAGYNASGTQFVMDNVTVVPATPTLSATLLHSFGGTDGGFAAAALTLGADGNFYGTTEYGGTNGYGTVFRMSPNGNLTTLVSFDYINGAYPAAALAQGADGKFYGSTGSGGASGNGTLFSVTTNAVLSSLFSFAGGNDSSVSATLIQGSDGNLYGTTPLGGTNGAGTVFKITTNGIFSTLASFPGFNNSIFGASLIQGSDGNFYGTTPEGGTNGDGAVFTLTTNGTFSTLASFDYTVTGYYPVGLVEGADGNFYGTTYLGGSNYSGTVFSVTPNGTLTSFASFDYGVTGAYPTAGVILGSDGNFYGTTYNGGIYNNGTIFSVTPNGVLSNLYSFEGSFGAPKGGLVEGTDGGFYGTTLYGGARYNGSDESGDGAVFRLGAAQAMTTPSIIAQPANQVAPVGGTAVFVIEASGAAPLNYGWQLNGSPIAGATQSCYSVTNVQSVQSGSQFSCMLSNASGSITSSDAALTVFTASGPVFSFNGPDGGYSTTALIQGLDGNFYGATGYGGTNGDGAVFRMTTNGLLSTLASLDQSVAGAVYPQAGLTLGADGNFYGTTYYGGMDELGTVFRMTTNGAMTTLLSFNNIDGAFPGVLVQGADGDFYGTTTGGGTYGGGTVFKVTTNGALSTLTSFNGGYPYAGLALGADGRFYGTTYKGGTKGYGSVFRIASNGSLATLFSFDNTHGAYPYGALAQGTNGNFYGVTYAGGSYGYGTAFSLTTNGALTTLLSFNIANGAYPYGGLVQGADGNFYGTTTQGGSGGDGTVFSMTTNGTLATLFSFNGANGSFPTAGLTQGRDGNFYGTTTYGGVGYDGLYWSGNGTVFRIVGVTAKEAPLIVTQPESQTVEVGANVTFSVSVSGSAPFSYQWQFNGVNLTDNYQIVGSQSNALTLTGVTINEAGTYEVVVTNAYGSATAFATLVLQPAPVLTWTNPAPITYGAILTSNQLNATANVPGSFTYFPTNGSVLNAGTNTLAVTFAPTNSADYGFVIDSVNLVVTPASLSVTASNAIRPYGQTNPVFTGVIIGVTNGDNITATYSCSAQTNSPAGTYPIVPALVDPQNRQTNYAITLANGTMTITGTPILNWTNPAPITYGTPLGPNQLNATTTLPGQFAYSPPSGSLLNAGSNLLSVIFTPSDTVDYTSATATVHVLVLNVVVSNNVLPTYEPFIEYAPNIATNTAGTQTNSIDLCTAGLIAPSGEPWLCQSFSGSAGTGLFGLDIQVTNYAASVFTSNNLSSLLPTTFPGYPGYGNAITTLVINPAQPLIAVGTNAPSASPNIVGNSAVLQFARELTRPASGTKTLFVSYLFDDAQQGQTGDANNGRYLCFVTSNNVLAGRASGGLHTNWQAMYNTFQTNAGPRYFSHAVRFPNALDVGPADSANGALPSPLSTLSTPFATAAFVVGEFVFVPTNASLAGIPDTNILWLNPPLSGFGGATSATNKFSAYPMLITMSDVGGLVLLDRPGSGQLGGVGTNYIANLILGNSWSYVTGGPEFTGQPANAFGSNVSLSACAVAAGQTITYQWQHVTGGTTNNLANGLVNPGGTAIVTIVTNANFTTLSLSNVSTLDAAGYYQVVAAASSTKFTLSSSAATVTQSLPPPPIIHFVYPPVINELAGDHVAYQASATGTGNIFYQWYHANNILPGQTGPTLVLTNIQAANAGQYEVTVVDSSGMYVTNSVTLNVSAIPWPLYPSNLVVVRLGDGVQTLSGAAGNTIYLDQYTTTGVYVSSLMVPDESVGSPYGTGSSASVSGSPALLLPGAGNDYANSGLLTLSANQQFLTFAGYCANYPFAGVDVTKGGAGYSRGLATVDAFGRYSLTYTNSGLYGGGNHSIRGAVTLDGTNFWTSGQAGSGGGIKYINTQNTIYEDGVGIPSISTSSATGTYAMQVFETNLVYADDLGSNGGGLYICGGTPEPAANGSATATLWLNEGGQPNDFAISPDGQTIYIADSGTYSNATLPAGGIQRWDTNASGGGYAFSYTMPVYQMSGAQGLAVYFPTNITQWGSNVLGARLFAVSPSNVLSAVIDNGPASTATVIVNNSPFNEQLHGVRFAPPVVMQTSPIITWPTPAPITYGTALGSNQLNASANVAGSFSYTPPAGSVLGQGVNTLSLVFTPADTFHYMSVTDTVSLVVTAPAPPIIKAARQSGSSFTITWSALTNQMYEIQSTTNLALKSWTTLGGLITATNSSMTISEPIGASSHQFYRVVLLP